MIVFDKENKREVMRNKQYHLRCLVCPSVVKFPLFSGKYSALFFRIPGLIINQKRTGTSIGVYLRTSACDFWPLWTCLLERSIGRTCSVEAWRPGVSVRSVFFSFLSFFLGVFILWCGGGGLGGYVHYFGICLSLFLMSCLLCVFFLYLRLLVFFFLYCHLHVQMSSM